jgi:hypothetical protein
VLTGVHSRPILLEGIPVFCHLRRTSLAFVGVTLLAALAGGFLGDFVHTDDGCAFETHCLACQRSIQSVGSLAPDLAPPPTLERVGSATTPPAASALWTPVRGEAPRGPPQA